MACPICDSTSFSAFGGRTSAVCDGCGALERQRALAREAAGLLAAGDGRWALEAGPLNPRVFGEHLRRRGWSYVAIDRWTTGNPADPRAVGFVDRTVDLSDMRDFNDHVFGLFVTQHVVEEIEDYERALDEIARVLAPGGHALMEIPFARGRTTRRAEPNRYGNVWAFGEDLLDRVAERFDALECVALAEGQYRGELLVGSLS
ncbi:class I SAM-dependent methyltransferase [Capillimicrobium parvum]|uniref:Methyltransferase type 11 domain-containing protein n=1 Tax=Capillimicrobium parvum TaxID=2884022 RepID=A0A9E6Y2Q0_9ACTN|nr:class I SAM-dependent methyltransferase [Capillimicrobium parvum]UGS38808.1 hypothetical protein DSM104329_05238 [Capillimicrobium parvum]